MLPSILVLAPQIVLVEDGAGALINGFEAVPQVQFHETLQLHPVDGFVSALDEVYHHLDGLLQLEFLPDVRVKLWISVKLDAAVYHYGGAENLIKESDVVYGAFI